MQKIKKLLRWFDKKYIINEFKIAAKKIKYLTPKQKRYVESILNETLEIITDGGKPCPVKAFWYKYPIIRDPLFHGTAKGEHIYRKKLSDREILQCWLILYEEILWENLLLQQNFHFAHECALICGFITN